MINEELIEFLEKYKFEKENKGFIPTVELLIEDLKDAVTRTEAERQIRNDKANS